MGGGATPGQAPPQGAPRSQPASQPATTPRGRTPSPSPSPAPDQPGPAASTTGASPPAPSLTGAEVAALRTINLPAAYAEEQGWCVELADDAAGYLQLPVDQARQRLAAIDTILS